MSTYGIARSKAVNAGLRPLQSKLIERDICRYEPLRERRRPPMAASPTSNAGRIGCSCRHLEQRRLTTKHDEYGERMITGRGKATGRLK